MNWRNIVISVLSVIITLLGGSQYQQANSLNEMKNNIAAMKESLKNSYNCDIVRFESD